MSSFVHHFKAIGEFNLELQSGNTQLGSKFVGLFVPCDLKIWRMTLKIKGAHLLCYFKLCASFHSHPWVTVRKRQYWVTFFVPPYLEIWQMTLKNNRTPVLCYFKLCVSFHSPLSNQNEVTVRSYSSETPNLGQHRRFFVPCDLEMWQMTNRAPLLCCSKLSALFHSHLWIQNGVKVQKRTTWVKIGNFYTRWPWNLTDDLEKQ